MLGGVVGGGGRPVPRASLVLGGEKPTNRRRGGLNGSAVAVTAAGMHVNGGGGGGGGGDAHAEIRRLVTSSMIDQNKTSSTSVAWDRQRRVDESSSLSHRTNVDNSSAQPDNDAKSTFMANGSTVVRSDDETTKHGKYSSDLIVVLDMDECLIHSQFLSDRLVDKYRQIEDRPSAASSESSFHRGVDDDNKNNNNKNNNIRAEAESALSLNACDSFRISLPDGDIVNVNKRPNLDIFLKEITSKFETYIFTAAMEVSQSCDASHKIFNIIICAQHHTCVEHH